MRIHRITTAYRRVGSLHDVKAERKLMGYNTIMSRSITRFNQAVQQD